MTLAPLTDDFEHRSPLSVRAPWDVARDEYAIELRDELDRRRTTYRGLVDRNTLTVAQARRYCEILRAALHYFDRRQPAPAEAVSHGAIVRELRREIMLRRNAYPKWVRSPTHDLTADTARLHSERFDAVHWAMWMELEGVTEGGFAAEPDDLARHALVIRLEGAARSGDWERRVIIGGDMAEAAQQERAAWVALGKLIDALAAGARWPAICAPARLAQLRDMVTATAAAAMDASCVDPAQSYRFARLYPLATWIQRLALAPCGPAVAPVEHREAA